MEQNNTDVSIVIVNYNTANLIISCIDSIFAKTKKCSYEIIIVDNASPDDSLSVLQDAFRENVKVSILPMGQNLGFGKANNAGLKVSKGEYIFFLNPDTLLKNDAIDILWLYMKSHKEIGACGGNLYDADLKPVHSFHRTYPSIFSDFSFMLFTLPEKLMYGKNMYFNHTNACLDVAFITGADLMIPRDVLNKYGAFSPEFFMYYEETELCRRIKQKGLRIVSVPEAEIIHLEGKSSSNMERKANMVSTSRNTYYSLTHSKGYKFISDFFFMWNCLYRVVYGLMKDKPYYIYWKTMLKSLYR